MPNPTLRPMLELGPFHGIDATTSVHYTAPDLAVDLLNIMPDRIYEAYVTAKGRVLGLTEAIPGTLKSFGKWYVSAGNYLAASLVTGSLLLYSFALGGAPSPLSLSSIASMSSAVGSFESSGQFTFYADPVNTPLKVDSAGNVTNWGLLIDLATTASTSDQGSGNLNGTYAWTYTLVNSTYGMESSPVGLSDPLEYTYVNKQVGVNILFAITDPQVTDVNIYRIGGTLGGTWLFVGTISAAVAEGPTPQFIDNVADSAVVGPALIEHRDPPPPCAAILAAQNRMWCFNATDGAIPPFDTTGYGATNLWYSNYAELTGFDNTNQVLPIGREDASNGDIGVGLAEAGSYILAFKAKSSWLVTGNTSLNIAPIPLTEVGCVSAATIASAYGVVFWLSDQGVWMFGGQAQNISDGNAQQGGIKAILDSFSKADLQAATGAMYDRGYLLSFPTQQISFFYYIATGRWSKLSFYSDALEYDLDNLNEVLGFNPTIPGQIDQWFSAETDYGEAISSYAQSRRSTAGTAPMSIEDVKQYRYGYLQAPTQPNANALIVTTIDPGVIRATGGPRSFSKMLDLGVGTHRHQFSYPPYMRGSEVQVEVMITSTQEVQVIQAAVHGYVKRRYVQVAKT